MIRPFLIVICAACFSLSERSVQAVQPQRPLLAKSGQQANPPFWASPLFLGGIGATSLVGVVTALVLKRNDVRVTPEISDSNVNRGTVPALPPASLNGDLRGTARSNPVEAGMLPESTSIAPAQIEETTRLAKINIIDELIQDLRCSDPLKRRKVIWELGQQGDTRAVQPLVDLLVDSDSNQRNLILSTLSEIGTRTLKPLTRALAISLQDENAEVRKNAIRDLTRVYDMVSQISHLLHKATEDSDQEVQETARWALGQLNRIRSTPAETLPALKNSVSSPESMP